MLSLFISHGYDSRFVMGFPFPVYVRWADEMTLATHIDSLFYPWLFIGELLFWYVVSCFIVKWRKV